MTAQELDMLFEKMQEYLAHEGYQFTMLLVTSKPETPTCTTHMAQQLSTVGAFISHHDVMLDAVHRSFQNRVKNPPSTHG